MQLLQIQPAQQHAWLPLMKLGLQEALHAEHMMQYT